MKYFFIFLSFFVLICTSFAQENDTINVADTTDIEETIAEWITLDPMVTTVENKVELKQVSLDERTSAFMPIVFFSPQSDLISAEYDPMFEYLATTLERNPDVILKIEGFYSKYIDDILAPGDCIDLAKRRVEAVRDKILKYDKNLVKRVLPEDNYDMSRPFFEDTTDFDMRASIDFEVEGFRTRSILLQDIPPYVRISYRDVIKNIYPKLDSILLRNPDIYIQIHAEGNPYDTPLYESYTRLKRAKDFLIKKMDKRLADRVTMLISPYDKMPRDIDIRLAFTPLGANIDNRKIISSDIADFDIHFLANWNRDIPVVSHNLRIYSDQTKQMRYIDHSEGSPEDTIEISSKNLPFLIGRNDIFLDMTDSRELLQVSESASISIIPKSFIYRLDMIGAIFGSNVIRLHNEQDPSLFRIAKAIIGSADISGKMMNITIQSFSDPDFFENEESDTLSEIRAEYVWRQISAMMISELELKDMDDLQKWFEKKSVEVFLEPQSADKIMPIEKNDPNHWLLNNRTNIIIELTSD